MTGLQEDMARLQQRGLEEGTRLQEALQVEHYDVKQQKSDDNNYLFHFTAMNL